MFLFFQKNIYIMAKDKTSPSKRKKLNSDVSEVHEEEIMDTKVKKKKKKKEVEVSTTAVTVPFFGGHCLKLLQYKQWLFIYFRRLRCRLCQSQQMIQN